MHGPGKHYTVNLTINIAGAEDLTIIDLGSTKTIKTVTDTNNIKDLRNHNLKDAVVTNFI